MYNLKLIIRKLLRNKLTSFALLFSLCIGFVAYIAISSYVIYEKTYDRYIPEYESIYRINTEVYSNNELAIKIPQCERILGEAMVEKFPNVISSGFICKTNNPQYKIEENIFTTEKVYHASSGLPDVLSIEIIKSKRTQVLTEPYKVIISESTAKMYFGDKDPIGEIIFKYPGYEYEVEGIFKDMPKNTHFKADMFLSFHDNMRLPPPLKDNWGETSFYTYVKVNPNTHIKDLEAGINQIVYENKKSYFENSNSLNKYQLQALKDIHLKSNLKAEITTNGRNDYLNILLVVSLLILLASGFNYVYFTYTRVLSNIKDIGIKKVFGITRKNLVKQFLGESFLIHGIAISVSFIICSLIQQLLYNSLGVDISLSFNYFSFWAIFITIYTLSSILTVIFPILMFQNKKPLELLSYKKKQSKHKFSFQQLITVAQFVIIISMISIITGIDKQINFLISKDKGLDISGSLVLKVPQNLRKNSSRINNFSAFEQELLNYPGISLISSSSAVPGDLLAYNFYASEKGKPNSIKSALYITDKSFLEICKVQLLAGNNFFDDLNQENAGCIINKTCLEKLGYHNPSEAIGRVLNLNDESQMQSFEIPIIGVCNDFNFQSMKESPDPMILLNWTQNMLWGNYIVKINNSKDFDRTNSFIKNIFQKTFINYPYEYFWLEDYYNKQYAQEQRLTLLLKFFVVLTILISVINLFSMVWYSSIIRTKEIGIRKVNGATGIEIIKMLNTDSLKWILLASVIAFPISFYSLSKWLEGFAYKTNLSWWIFVLSGLFALTIGALTISWQTFKVANMNPANALRHE
ncbi:MAG: ABC transporter permease [Bacteroidales bacterium]|nr:ABC transporter permease [Bacteroidales bacterium]